ncbi:MAG: hypothetical protein RLZZ241_1611 [Bacteroidota bacterium]|jgi:UDP-N-acetylmuramate dehydrogenase
MCIEENISLKAYNTFGIDVHAARFARIQNLKDLQKILTTTPIAELFVLSGGSNVLFTGPVNKLVLFLDVPGKSVVEETKSTVTIRVNCGENWHEMVMWTLEQGWGGLENLALIPGKCGTAPVQNIGAYGVEIKDVLQGLHAIELNSGEMRYFKTASCAFGYRDSIFKGPEKGNYIIWSIDLKLTKAEHVLKTGYGDIQKELSAANIEDPTPLAIAQAVIAIRQQKLPDPKVLGNSGSFFKNPIISQAQYNHLKILFPDMPGYPQPDTGHVKVPAGWLIEKIGFKGYRKGDAGVHQNQALVLVNFGSATGTELLQLSREIQEVVYKQFKIVIAPEVNII